MLTRTALTRVGSEWRLETSCASPFAGMAYFYRLYPVALALGGATGAEGARADALYLSEGNGPWRLVGAGLSSFRASVRYRAGDGEVRVDPEGRFLPGGFLSPYLSLEGKGFYLEDLLLGGRIGDRDPRVAAFLGHPAQAERVRTLVACGPGPRPASLPRGHPLRAGAGPPPGGGSGRAGGGPPGVLPDSRGLPGPLRSSRDLHREGGGGVRGRGHLRPHRAGEPRPGDRGGRATVTVTYARAGVSCGSRWWATPWGLGERGLLPGERGLGLPVLRRKRHLRPGPSPRGPTASP